jgi:hypothetical protein
MDRRKKVKLSAVIDYSLRPDFGGTHALTYNDPHPDRGPVTIRFWTPHLANIPWVRALIRAARREVQHKESIHERADVEYDTGREGVDDALDNVLPSREDDECLDGLVSALKPFEGVDYE